ncbi:MAG: hypothetical protein ACKPKO_36470, partial [Candidatus Fonsibacter sp.]
GSHWERLTRLVATVDAGLPPSDAQVRGALHMFMGISSESRGREDEEEPARPTVVGQEPVFAERKGSRSCAEVVQTAVMYGKTTLSAGRQQS